MRSSGPDVHVHGAGMGEFAPPPPYHETRVDKNMAEVKDVTMKEVPEEGKDGKGDEDADQQPKTKKDKDVLTVEGS